MSDTPKDTDKVVEGEPVPEIENKPEMSPEELSARDQLRLDLDRLANEGVGGGVDG